MLQPGESIRIEDVLIDPCVQLLVGLEEPLSAIFRVQIQAQEKELWARFCPVRLLTYDQWSGSEILPEMLVAFVTPAHPAVEHILDEASLILEEWTGNPLFDNYQTLDINRVKQQMAAVFTVISRKEIIYDTHFVSFNEEQKIRSFTNLLDNKKANSLEISLLYAACLEAAKLHPIIVIHDGEAFAGAWLVQETFPDKLIDDSAFLSGRTAEGVDEILLVDVKGMNKEEQVSFGEAALRAVDLLSNDEDFLYALDIKRARLNGIRPIAKRIRNNEEWIILHDESDFKQETQTLLHELLPVEQGEQELLLNKQILWERKLLDLSLRNNLLNLRITKNTLRLASADLASFEDALADGKEFRIVSVTDKQNSLSELEEFNLTEINQTTKLILKHELAQHRLRSSLPDEELKKSLQHLYRSSRLSMEENGANTLYLALGFLKWFETPSSIKPRYAPILLLPVEMIRKSSAGGFVIRSREEDTLLNITLLEMLRQNFGITIPGLDPLPVDDSGVNVNLINSIIKNSIKSQDRWEVEEDAVLGIFSFSKFIMWNDLHNNADKLSRNQVVSSLMNGMLKWNAEDMAADASVMDKELTPADILLPIGADSSQLEAIFEAVEGTSFILHGPPGTGKSQTITNIIVNALYRGKRVLFVAEKMAALSVVQSRLAALGLDPFCLELHSNKSKKSAVMEQIKKTTEITRYKSPAQFSADAERLHGLRSELNKYIDGLHIVYPFGLSLYDSIIRYLSHEESKEISFPADFPAVMTNEIWQELEEIVREAINVGNTFGHPAVHPLLGIKFPLYSTALKEKADRLLKETIDTVLSLKEKLPLFYRLVGETASFRSCKHLELTGHIIDVLSHIPELTSVLLTKPALPDVVEEFKEVVGYGVERDHLRKDIFTTFDETVLQIPAALWLNKWKQAEQKWFLPRFFGQRKIYRELKRYCLQKVEKEKVSDWLATILQAQDKEKQIEEYRPDLVACFGRIARANKEDWSKIELSLELVQQLHSLIIQYTGNMEEAIFFKEKLAHNLSQGVRSFREVHATLLQELSTYIKNFAVHTVQLETLLGVDTGKLYETPENSLDQSLSHLKKWHENLDRLKDWYQWLRVYEKMEEKNIAFFADSYVEEKLPVEDLLTIFRKSYWKVCIQYIFSCCPDLELFNGGLFEAVIKRYRDLSHEFENLTRRELYGRLASNIPYFTQEGSRNSEVWILQKNIRNNARGMSIRRLFDQIPTLLKRLSPCMLMSPISVAQYIDPDAEPFDLIIFDEASQMPTYEAVGAMARGKHVVIVGDPKQMPPTSFFMNNTVDEENIEMEDLESILDDCLALSMPSKHLLWHYRSRHESLIAFSNAEYYENKLLTFPSPDNIQSKVTVIPVNGFYDKGKTRQNRREAEAVVKEIIRRLSDKELRKKSIGVVTFSSVQQILVEDLLSEVLDTSPELEKYAYAAGEPIFIKNLENVQGDERDVILFSVGYGPDANGKVSMNFGPLNRIGGERRLNVAVSRARYEMIIFSTLSSDMIDLNRTSSVGVAGLKRFLEYAEKGVATHLRTTNNPDELSIAELIAAGLRRLGYTVHTHIGCSGYRIDVAIVDEASPSEYIVGILCDGKNYKNTKTARDREIVQNSVLKQLGWNIYRVWTLDWHENKEAVMGSIMQHVDQLKNDRATKEKISISKTEFTKSFILPFEEEEKEIIKEEEVTMYEGINYVPALLSPQSENPEDFFQTNNRRKVIAQIKDILQTESPISKSLLCKRIMPLWNVNRQTQRFDTYMDEVIKKGAFYISAHEELLFLWESEQHYKEYSIYRVQSDRDPSELPPEEVANGVKDILKQQISMPLPDLVRTTGQLFGFARSGPNIDAAMFRGIQEAVRRGYIKLNGGKVLIK